MGVTAGSRVTASMFANIVAYQSLGGTATLGNAGAGDVVILTLNFTAQAGVTYLLLAQWYAISPGGTTSADTFTMNIKNTGGSKIAWSRQKSQSGANVGQCGSSMMAIEAPGAGAVTYTFTGNHDGGGAYSASVPTPAWFAALAFPT